MTDPAADFRDLFGDEIIHGYSRAQALADGTLIPADEKLCAEYGIVFPMAFTAAAWADTVAWTDADTKRTGALQDQTGRLWDVLTMYKFAVRRAARDATRVRVEVLRISSDNPPHGQDGPEPTIAVLHVQCGPGDNAEPVLTVMLPHES